MQCVQMPPRMLGKLRARAQRGSEMTIYDDENCFPQLRFVVAFISRLYLLIMFLCFPLFSQSNVLFLFITLFLSENITSLVVLFPIKVSPLDMNGNLYMHVYTLFQLKWERKKVH